MKTYISKGFWCFLGLFASGWIAVAASFLPVLVSRFFMPMGSVGEGIVIIVSMTVVIAGSMFVRSYRSGYKSGTVNLKMTVISFVIGIILHFLYNFVFNFAFYTAGPAFEIGKLVYTGGKRLEEILPRQYVVWNMWYFYLLYLGAVCLGERMGVKKRLRDREEVTGRRTIRNKPENPLFAWQRGDFFRFPLCKRKKM